MGLTLNQKEKQYFMQCARELLESGEVQRMNQFIQHANVTTLEHSISVAYYSYWLCRRLHLHADCRSIIRGALLHDFFLYDWHVGNGEKGLHGFTHPRIALANAESYFVLNDMERDIIVKHMWPLTVIPPKYKESLIVSLSDKFCSVIETLRLYPKLVSR